MPGLHRGCQQRQGVDRRLHRPRLVGAELAVDQKHIHQRGDFRRGGGYDLALVLGLPHIGQAGQRRHHLGGVIYQDGMVEGDARAELAVDVRLRVEAGDVRHGGGIDLGENAFGIAGAGNHRIYDRQVDGRVALLRAEHAQILCGKLDRSVVDLDPGRLDEGLDHGLDIVVGKDALLKRIFTSFGRGGNGGGQSGQGHQAAETAGQLVHVLTPSGR